MYTKHGLNRMLERIVLTQNKKFNKKQRKRYKNKAKKKLNEDMKKMIAYYNCSDGRKIIYSDLKKDNSCTKYVLSETKKIITVMKVDFIKEKENKPLKLYKEIRNNI